MEIYHYWIILGLALMIAEIFTPGFLLASFGVGAFGGSLFAFMDYEFKIQLLAFSGITMIVFFAIRPMFLKYFYRFGDQRETGINAYIGKIYTVTETISNTENLGRVKIGSESWLARAGNDESIESGERVTVLKVEGSTLFVSSVKGKGE